jgi:predicted glycosyltransferase
MNILFDIGHPAHVHLFKNLILYLKENKYNITVVSREKDVANDLLKHYEIDAISLSKVGATPIQMFGELMKRDFGVIKLHRRLPFDYAFGTSYSIAHLSAVSKVKSFVFEEDDDDILPLFSTITYPFATGIVIPSCLRYRKWKKKRVIHNSYHELAYLHPDNFSPDKQVLKKYKLEPGTYILLRSSALKAHHDLKIRGLEGTAWQRVYELFKDYTIISSREGEDEHRIEPWDMHHVMASSKMLVSDSQTMTMEAAALGIPSVRYNSFAGKISYLEEAEHKYGLTFGFKPGEDDEMVRKVEELLENKNLVDEWQNRRKLMLADKINFFEWQINFIRSLH